MKMALSSNIGIAVLIAVLGLCGCSANPMIVNEWSNPRYVAPSFKRIMVASVGEETSIRRNLEDEFVAQLNATGITALPSYRYMPQDEKIDESKLKQAAQKAGADSAILARSIGVEEKTEYGPNYYPLAGFGIFGRHVGASWSGPYGAPRVSRYNVYTSEATLYDVNKNEVVWTGTIRTTEPDNIDRAIKDYVQAVIKALNEKDLVRIKKEG